MSSSPRIVSVSALLAILALAVSACASTGNTHPGGTSGASPWPSPSATTGAPESPSGNPSSHHEEGDLPSDQPTASGGGQPSEAPGSGTPPTSGDTSGGDESPSSTDQGSTATGEPTTGEPSTSVPSAPSGTATGAHVNCSKVKCVALTFDDGPGPYTGQILDTLQAAGARATFFVIGTQVKRYPDLVKREAALGMEIGNHTWDHPNLTTLSPAAQLSEFAKVDDAVRSLTGQTPRFLRPPGGALTKTEKVALKRPIADWAVDTEDWRTRNTASTVRAASAAKPGEIVLMHDIHASTAAAVGDIVKNLQAKGYHLVTLTELIGEHPTLGIAYGWGRKPSGS